MKYYTLILFGFATLFAACNRQNQKAVEISSDTSNQTNRGDTVSELDQTILIVFQANNNDYWFGSNGAGVFRYDGRTIVHFATQHGLCNNQIREIKEDQLGNIYFTTLAGISKFDGANFTTLPVVEGAAWKLESDDLWFIAAGKNGVYRYDGESLYHLEFPKHYLADDFYAAFPNPSYSPYEVYTIYKDRQEMLWFGTSNFGICRFDGQTLSWMFEKHLSEIEGGGQFGIRSIIEDKDREFWFCNTSYRYRILSSSSIEPDRVLIDYEREPGMQQVKSPEGKPMIYFMSVVEDQQGDLWMVTYGQGVWRYNGETMTRYVVKDGEKEIKLFSIYKDKRGELWLGTHDDGAYKFNGNSFEKFKPSN